MADSAVVWLTAFLDFPAASFERGIGFWQGVTGYGLSPWRGGESQFATLVPAAGDDYLRVQRIGDGAPRVHIDLHTLDVAGLAQQARELGASERHPSDVATFDSPGGFTFCVVEQGGHATVPPARQWAGGQRSRPDQVCLDIPPGSYEAEAAFWSALTAWDRSDPDPEDEFERLRGSGPVQLLLQRLGDEQDRVTAHLDIACSGPEDEVQRHLGLGASRQYDGRGWITLADPTGMPYCVTKRPPS